jgi:hypothetical protein
MPFISPVNSGQLHRGSPAKALAGRRWLPFGRVLAPGLGARTTIKCYYYQSSFLSASDPALGVRGLEWIGRQFQLAPKQT